MKGLIYIAGSFETVDRGKCGRGKRWIDNDPHFWNDPPTWGICRNDLRRKVDPLDYVFFVLPKGAKHPQTLFGYLRVTQIKTHAEAYRCKGLRAKRMGKKNPNGNIIVDASGRYNRFDAGVHKGIFEKVKQRYAVGDPAGSRMFTATEIRALAPGFVSALCLILKRRGQTPIELISRYGRELSESQVEDLLKWVAATLAV